MNKKLASIYILWSSQSDLSWSFNAVPTMLGIVNACSQIEQQISNEMMTFDDHLTK
jgi:hypothetical protein